MPHAYTAARLEGRAADPLPRQHPAGRRGVVLATVCGAAAMVNLDLSAVNIALAEIRSDLGLSVSGLTWVLNGYTLSFACLIAAAGRLGDMRGRRRALVGGAVVFVAASTLCGLAQGDAWLIAARVVQGGGAAFMFPAMLAIVADTYPGKQRTVAIGTVVAVASASQSAGPLIGGLLTDAFGWRLIFFVNVPIGIAVVVAALRFVDESRDEAAPQRLDWAGVTLMVAGLVAASVALDQGDQWGWGSVATVGMLAVGVLALVAFVAVEFRVTDPLIGPALLRNRTFQATNVSGALLFVVYFPMLMYAALLLQEVLGFSALEAGMGLFPLVALMAVLSRPVAKLSTRWGPTVLMTLGFALAAAGALWFGLTVSTAVGYLDVVGPLVVFGAGIGFAVALNSSTAVASVPAGQSGTASGVNFAVRLTGGVVGLAAISTLFEDEAGAGSSAETFVDAFEPAMFVLAGVAVLGGLVTSLFVRLDPAADADEAPS